MQNPNTSFLRFSEDFRQADHNGTRYVFNGSQARAIEVLVKAWQSGLPACSGSKILKAVSRPSKQRPKQVFEHRCRASRETTVNPAWGTLVVAIPGPELRGYYQLNLEPGTVISRMTEEDLAIPPPPVSTRKRWRKRLVHASRNGAK